MLPRSNAKPNKDLIPNQGHFDHKDTDYSLAGIKMGFVTVIICDSAVKNRLKSERHSCQDFCGCSAKLLN